MTNVFLVHDDCLNHLKTLPSDSLDSIVTDPPYGISFMSKHWDHNVPKIDVWQECLRVLKPGGYLLAFAGTRTQHRMACNIEDAGFDIKDMIAWVYGSGFPKNMDISKQIDKKMGVTATNTGQTKRTNSRKARGGGELVGAKSIEALKHVSITMPTSDEAKTWEGWGTALKPALEPITLARKPHKGTIADNVLKHSVGGLHINACRVAATGERLGGGGEKGCFFTGGWHRPWMQDEDNVSEKTAFISQKVEQASVLGRFPANLIHDGSDEVLSHFPKNAGAAAKVKGTEPSNVHNHVYNIRNRQEGAFYGDKGSAARFFYCAKSSPNERNYGLPYGEKNQHVTVKPIALMRYLVRLVTPIGGTVYDPYMGSGTTGIAAIQEGCDFIGTENDLATFQQAKKRVHFANQHN